MTHAGRARVAARLTPLCLVLLGAPVAARAQALLPFDARSIGGWRASATVDQTWERNVLFVESPSDPDQTTRARLEAARLWQTARDRVAITGSGGLLRFQRRTELNRASYDAGLLATHAFSRLTTGTLDYRARSDYTNRVITAAGEGALLRGLVAARTQEVVATATRRVSPVVDARFSADYQAISFDSPELVNGWYAAAAGRVSRRERHSTWALDYGARRSSADGRLLDVQQATGEWQHLFAGGVRSHLSAGTALIGLPRESSHALAFVGDGGVVLGGQRNAFDARYQRSVGQEYGVDSAVVATTDAFSLQYRRALGRNFHVSSNARQAWSDGQLDRTRRATSLEGGIDARYVLRSGIGLGVGGFYRRRDDRVVIEDHGVTVGVGFGWSQVRSMPANPEPALR